METKIAMNNYILKKQKVYKAQGSNIVNIHPGDPKGLPDDYFLKYFYLMIFSLVVLSILILATNIIYAAESNLQANVIVLGEFPFITINNPIDNAWYNSKSIILNVSLLEKVKYLYYKINTKSFSKLCSNCDAYAKKKGFLKGENNLTIRALKYDNTNEYSSITFYIDSIKPKISSTYPSKIGNGLFGVKYREANLRKVTLFYWPSTNPSNIKSKEFTNCNSGTNIRCYDNVDISEYNGKYIYYKFELKDDFFSTNSSTRKILVNTTGMSGISGMAVSDSNTGILSSIAGFFSSLF